MDKIGIKFLEKISYEQFESLGYLLHYDFEYEDIESYIEEQKVIELDIDEEEDREDDLEVLRVLLAEFDSENIRYEIFNYK